MKSLLLLPLLAVALVGCVSDRQRTESANSAATIYEAAKSLPPATEPQRAAIMANASAICTALGEPYPPAAPAATPATR